MRKRITVSHSTMALALVLGAMVTPAQSVKAEVEASEDNADGAIVVTARRREENLLDVPMAVSAFSGETLANRGVTNISEIAQAAPSVTIEPSRATNSTLTAFIRGVGQQDPLAGFEPGVAIYIDDIYLARPQGALLDVYDVERVEVLRGPQGSLYGRNAVGGAIKYVTRRLGPDPEFSGRVSYGSYDQIDVVAKGSVPIGDAVRIGAAVASLNRDGYGANFTTGQDNYNKDLIAVRGSLELMPSEEIFIRISGDYTDDDSNPVAGYRPFPGAVSGTPVLSNFFSTFAGAATNASTAGINGQNEVEAGGINVLIEWEASDNVTLKSITAWRKDRTFSVIDFDSLAVDDFDAPVIYRNKQFSQELQLLYQSDRLNGVFGFYYLDAEASNDFDVVLGQLGRTFFGAPLTAFTGGSVDTSAWSIFGDFTYDFNDQFSATIGGRYTEDKRTADIFRASFLGTGSPAFGNVTAIQTAVTSDYEASRTFKNFSPRALVNFKPNDDVNIYASYSRGFKAGSFDPRGSNFSSPEVVNGYEPEILDSFEAGLKTRFGRSHINIAAFYSDYKDLQVPGSLPIDTNGDGVNDDFIGAVTNAGKATIKGIELEANIEVADGLTLIANGSLLDSEYKRFIVNGVNVADMRQIQNTPDFQSFLGLNYNTDFVWGGTINFFGSWSHKSSITQFETPVPAIDQPAYDLFDAAVTWTSDDGHWTLAVQGKNLSDEIYRTSGYNFPTLGLENNITVFHGPPRTATFTVGFRF